MSSRPLAALASAPFLASALFASALLASTFLAACGACPAVDQQWNHERRAQQASLGTATFPDARPAPHARFTFHHRALAHILSEHAIARLEGERRRRVVLDAEVQGTRVLLTIELTPTVERVELLHAHPPTARLHLSLHLRVDHRVGNRQQIDTLVHHAHIDLPLELATEPGSPPTVLARFDRAIIPPVDPPPAPVVSSAAPHAASLIRTMLRQRITEDDTPAPLLLLDTAHFLGHGIAVRIDQFRVTEDHDPPHLEFHLVSSLFPSLPPGPPDDPPDPGLRWAARLDLHPGLFQAALRHRLLDGRSAARATRHGLLDPDGRLGVIVDHAALADHQARINLSLYRDAGRCSITTMDLAFPVHLSPDDGPSLATPEVSASFDGRGRPRADEASWTEADVSGIARSVFRGLLDTAWVRLPPPELRPGLEASRGRGVRVGELHLTDGHVTAWWVLGEGR